MENKYYIPDISDIRIGYECEKALLDSDWYITGWEQIIIQNLQDIQSIKDYPNLYRTSFLTREEIETEGWEHIGGQLSSFGRQDFIKTIILENVERELELSIYNDHTMYIILLEKNPCDNGCGPEYLYQGSCPSINEFRFIIKLLQI